ncbi:uncharacterized protein [Macrobrachium rosenbergii]|uniref:uncharacterized protein isoform X1 n=2 Tax=Macrobrachium rosenbergii TaxID=79674 RepID=UPI0034D75773
MNWNCLQRLATVLLTVLLSGSVKGCNMKTKEVGVCLHVYLERDFLSMERIVYPLKNAQRREIYSYRQAPPKLPELDEVLNATQRAQGDVTYELKGRHQHRLRKDGSSWRRVKRSRPDNYAIIDTYGQHGWVEGPELEDYCSRLGGVITCFEEVLIGCESGYDFFRYRHLLHSLERVHKYLCHTPNDRLTRFLPFLMVIDCAETARLKERSCHRPNVTVNVWNQILRMELGPELCNSLNTQRACLLENGYINQECGGEGKEGLYRNVSAIFLATWCRLPLPPSLLPYVMSSSSQCAPASFITIVVTACAVLLWKKQDDLGC